MMKCPYCGKSLTIIEASPHDYDCEVGEPEHFDVVGWCELCEKEFTWKAGGRWVWHPEYEKDLEEIVI